MGAPRLSRPPAPEDVGEGGRHAQGLAVHNAKHLSMQDTRASELSSGWRRRRVLARSRRN